MRDSERFGLVFPRKQWPGHGAGDEDYPHKAVDHHAIGKDSNRVWILSPGFASARNRQMLLSSCTGGSPWILPPMAAGWATARRGNIVLYPLFEKTRSDPPKNSLRNAIESTKQALQYLADEGPVKPELSDFAGVGHSFGGGLLAQMAGLAASSGLPQLHSIMPVMPGWLASRSYPTDNLAGIPHSTYLLIVEGDRDQFQDTRHGSTIFNATTIPPDQKAFVRLLSRKD